MVPREDSISHPRAMRVKDPGGEGIWSSQLGSPCRVSVTDPCALLSHRWGSLGPGESPHVLDCGPRAHSHITEPGRCRMGQLWAADHCPGCCHSADSGTHTWDLRPQCPCWDTELQPSCGLCSLSRGIGGGKLHGLCQACLSHLVTSHASSLVADRDFVVASQMVFW